MQENRDSRLEKSPLSSLNNGLWFDPGDLLPVILPALKWTPTCGPVGETSGVLLERVLTTARGPQSSFSHAAKVVMKHFITSACWRPSRAGWEQ